MQQDPRRGQNALFFSRRAVKAADPDLRRVGDELEKLRRFGAPTGGFAKQAPAPAPAPVAPKPLSIYVPPPIAPLGVTRRSELQLPLFVPPPAPMPAPPPQPAARRIGPAPTRVVNIKNAMQLATALEQAKPGDHFVLAEGEYPMPNRRFQLKGTAERPIALVAGAANVVLLGGNAPHTLQLDRSEHVIVNGFRFAARGAQTARAINITDSNHVVIAGCWIGEGAPSAYAPVHFGADASGRYNNFNHVIGNVIYASGGPAVHFGPGGGQGARIVDNELRAVGPESQFAGLVTFTPGAMSAYRGVTLRGNRLIGEVASGGGFALNGVIGADISGNTVLLKRDAEGQAGALFEVRSDAAAGGQVTGLLMHHNEFGYDRPGHEESDAPFRFGAPLQATFAHNVAGYLGPRWVDGRFAAMVDTTLGLQSEA